MNDRSKDYDAIIDEIDNINQQDPRTDTWDGRTYAYEYLYSLRMTEALNQYYPQASTLLKIAAHGQHIKRWSLPRTEYSADRKGYLIWRTEAKKMHCDILGSILSKYDFSDEEISQVSMYIMKSQMKSDEESQALEDVVCLVFLKYYITDFIKDHEDDKVVSIIGKTWRKMSPKAHNEALKLDYEPRVFELIKRALS
ncbi:DUF4202 domain-containing protein [Fulvivirga ligni]|uniref:DUF4202 domain-containing protein n=1 Tax=Fulvivirga ligni TaxID=2904246 RepID=UPI001F2DEBA2|nr:DUF4202 domain-containing protein [Fulvivirga ligni]UII22396.1 DUF4202 domain-containing protein [Fulvivirga ligni]